MPRSNHDDPGLPVKDFKDHKAWQKWLVQHSTSSAGLWLQLAKKGTRLHALTYPEAVDVALCYGWIDGQKKSHDETSWLQKFTPRGARSLWSKINRSKAMELIRQGRMQAAGLAAVERAKGNGCWDAAYDSSRTAELPRDFEMALAQHPKAKAFFATLNSRNRYAIMFRLQTARRAATRQKRIDLFVDMLGRRETLYP